MESLKTIIGLLKVAKEDKKLGLEIQKLEDEARNRESLIRPATIEEINKYDPRRKELEDIIEESRKYRNRIKYSNRIPYAPAASSIGCFWVALILGFLVALYLFMR